MPKNHRTALVIDLRNGNHEVFQERYRRLLESVNGDNIKVDVYTVLPSGRIVEGAPGNANPETVVDIDEWAASLGYDQVVRTAAPRVFDGCDCEDCEF